MAWGMLRGPLGYAALAVLAFAMVSSAAFWRTAISASRRASALLGNAGAAAQHRLHGAWVVSAQAVTRAAGTVYTTFRQDDSGSAGATLASNKINSNGDSSANMAPPSLGTNNGETGASALLKTASGDDASLDTALAKLEEMLVAVDTNTSFVTNKTSNVGAASGVGPKRDDILNEIGIVLLQKGERAAALARWQEAIAFNPAAFRAQLNLGQALYKGSSDGSPERAEAIRVLGDVLKLRHTCQPHKQVGKKEQMEAPEFCEVLASEKHKDDVEDTWFKAQRLLGQIHFHGEKPLVAETYFKQALKMRPWDQQVQLLLGGVYEEMGMMGQAQAYYKQCSKLGTARGHGMMEEEKRRRKKEEKEALTEGGGYGAACARRSRELASKLAAWQETQRGKAEGSR